jgi:acetate CoA/acetoacetate CoA-transferase alpha subunit
MSDESIQGKVIEWKALTPFFRNGMTIMFGGFMGIGTPEGLVDALRKSGVGELTLIGNDTAFPDTGVGPLIEDGQVSHVMVSHIGTNPRTGERMINGDLGVELIPQGTLIERIRCGGGGLGGVLTPTGVGTPVEEGKQRISVEGRDYLLELPLRADLALLKAHRADPFGNLVYQRAARNFNPVIAMAADCVLVEADELCSDPLDPDQVVTPGVLVDHIVVANEGVQHASA